MAKKTPIFILNDQTVANSYGFYVVTQGINLGRFKTNPVMLSDHHNDNLNVIGRWINIKIEDGQLTATPEFDIADEDSNKIAGKVNRDFIRGASMGLLFDPSDLVSENGRIILTKCELTEASIVPVPSNKNAVRLYNTEGDLMEDEEIKALCLSVNKPEKKPTLSKKDEPMKIKLNFPTIVALGLTKVYDDGIESSELEPHITRLSQKYTALESANKTLTASIEAQKDGEINTIVETALTAGKFNPDKKQSFIELGKVNLELLKSTIDAIPDKVSLSGQLRPVQGIGEVKTMDDFQKLPLEQQLFLKNDNPDQYALILTNKTK